MSSYLNFGYFFKPSGYTASEFGASFCTPKNRILEVLHVPGHTLDSMALLDAEHGLLFTGDTFNDGGLWLQVLETNLHDFQASITRLTKIEGRLRYLFGGHTSARVEAGRLRPIGTAIAEILSGESGAGEAKGDRIVFRIDGVEILTTRNALDGKQSDQATGGSGLDVWPR
jgi:glyoxylase-like metal-dependent hydrolase (beta-lactamase superfamily II)